MLRRTRLMSSICLGIHGFSVILFQSVVLGGLLLYVGGFYTCVSSVLLCLLLLKVRLILGCLGGRI